MVQRAPEVARNRSGEAGQGISAAPVPPDAKPSGRATAYQVSVLFSMIRQLHSSHALRAYLLRGFLSWRPLVGTSPLGQKGNCPSVKAADEQKCILRAV